MSAGPFVDSKYQAAAENGGGVHYIKIQPETLGLTIATVANSNPSGPINSKLSATVSGSTRRRGLHAAKIYFKFSSTVPTGYLANSILSLPGLNKEILAVADKGATGTYLGQNIIVSGKSPEILRQ